MFRARRARAKILFYATGECELLHIGQLKIMNLKSNVLHAAIENIATADFQFCDEGMIDP
jgi:hypothetical protein